MRIVFVTANPFPSYSGGMENWLFHVLRVLDRDGRVEAVVVSPDSAAPPFYDISGLSRVSLVRTAQPRSESFVSRSVAHLPRPFRVVLSNAQRARWVARTWAALRRHVRRDDALVVIHSVPGMLPAALFKMTRREVRVVCSVRGRIGLDLDQMGLPKVAWIYRRLERLLLGFADAVHANGADTAAYLRDDLAVASEVVPNGVDVEAFARQGSGGAPNAALEDLRALRARGVRTVGTVATLRDVKGIRFLIQAAAHLSDSLGDSVRFVFVGKGDPAPYANYAHQLGVGDRMLFTGEQKDVPAFLHELDICIAISGGGGVSNAAIEMMAAGRPVVAWDNATYSQLIEDGRTGILVEDRNARALAAGIAELVDQPDYRATLGLNAATVAKRYSWDTVVPRFVAFVQHAGSSPTEL